MCIFSFLLKFLMGLLVSLWLVGCAQNTEAPVDQPTRQVQEAQTGQAAQGAHIVVNNNFGNAPYGSTQAAPESGMQNLLAQLTGEYATSRPSVETINSDADKNTVQDTKAGYVMVTTLTQTIYGSSTGAQTGTATPGQASTPGSTTTQTPTLRPETQVNPALSVAAPGGAATASTSSNLESAGGTASSTASPQNDLRTALTTLLNQPEGVLQSVIGMIQNLLATPAATTQPVE